MDQVQLRAVHALKEAFVGVNGRDVLGADGYAITTQANLLYTMSRETQADFGAGAGREMDWNMRAPHSSSALVANAFERWRADPEHLELAGLRSIETITFEKKYPTGLPGTPPHLDVVAEAADAIVAVESKCTEYLKQHVPHFKPSYRTLAAECGKRSWFRYVTEGVASSMHLPVAQRRLEL